MSGNLELFTSRNNPKWLINGKLISQWLDVTLPVYDLRILAKSEHPSSKASTPSNVFWMVRISKQRYGWWKWIGPWLPWLLIPTKYQFCVYALQRSGSVYAKTCILLFNICIPPLPPTLTHTQHKYRLVSTLPLLHCFKFHYYNSHYLDSLGSIVYQKGYGM